MSAFGRPTKDRFFLRNKRRVMEDLFLPKAFAMAAGVILRFANMSRARS